MYTICPKCQFRTVQNRKMCGACGFVRAHNVVNPLQEIYENTSVSNNDIDWAASLAAARTLVITAAHGAFKRARVLIRAMRKRAAEVHADVPVDRQ